MEQLSFFAEAGQSKGLSLEMLEYTSGIIDSKTSDLLLAKFIRDTPWKQTVKKLWEKQYMTPRYGELGSDFLRLT